MVVAFTGALEFSQVERQQMFKKMFLLVGTITQTWDFHFVGAKSGTNDGTSVLSVFLRVCWNIRNTLWD